MSKPAQHRGARVLVSNGASMSAPQIVATGEVYRGHVIVRRPYGRSCYLYEATCPYAPAPHTFSVRIARSRAEMRANIDEHLTGTFRLCSRDFDGLLPQCPGGAGETLRVARPTRTCDLCGKPNDEVKHAVHLACMPAEARWDDRLRDRGCDE